MQRAVAELSEDIRHDLAGIKIEAADLPDESDLTAEKPPLSPTILGLFRGLPLDFGERATVPTPGRPFGQGARGSYAALAGSAERERPGRPRAGRAPSSATPRDRAIVLYRRNLLRTVHDSAELDQAIVRTLLHEVGHLRGEDDGSLRDRGLE